MRLGLQTGQQLALRRMLTKQLTKRFGVLSVDIDMRIEQAALEQLETWLDRVIDAPSLQEVFSTETGGAPLRQE